MKTDLPEGCQPVCRPGIDETERDREKNGNRQKIELVLATDRAGLGILDRVFRISRGRIRGCHRRIGEDFLFHLISVPGDRF